jgi:hypothetical protein
MLSTIPFYVYMTFDAESDPIIIIIFISVYYFLEGRWNKRSLNRYLKKELNIALTRRTPLI